MQGAACVFPAFREVFQEVHQDEGAVTSSVISMPGTRTFRNAAGDMRWCATAIQFPLATFKHISQG